MKAIIALTLFFQVTHFPVSQAQHLTGMPVDTVAEYVMGQIEQFYIAHPYIDQEVTYSLYSDFTSTIPYAIEKGVYIRSMEASYSQLASIESLTTKTLSIGVDHDEKVVMISNTISIPATDPSAIIRSQIPSGATVYVAYVSDRYGEIVCQAEFGEIEEARIVYNLKTFQPLRILLTYRRTIQLSDEADSPFVSPRMEIEYTRTSFDQEGRDNLDIDTYCIRSKGEWRLAPALASYELIQNIQQLPNQQ